MPTMTNPQAQENADPPTRAEEGEKIGTLHQFAEILDAPRWTVLQCAEENEHAIVMSRQEGGEPVFILEAEALNAISQCAEE